MVDGLERPGLEVAEQITKASGYHAMSIIA